MFIETYFISFNIAYTYSIIYSDVILNKYLPPHLFAMFIGKDSFFMSFRMIFQ